MSAPVEPTPPVTANRAPNWYPDPEDQDGTLCRWWDGSAWTEHTRVVAAAPVASRWSRRSLLALVAALVIGLVLGGGGIYTFLSRNTEAPPVAAPTTDPAASDPADTDPAAPETPGTPGGGEAPAGESVPAPPAPPAPPADVTPPVVVEIPAEPVVVNMPPLVPAPESATVPITSLMSVYVGLWRSDNSAEIPQLAALQGVLSAAAPAAGDAPGMRGYLATQCPQVTQLGTFRALGASAPEDPVIRTHLNNYFLLAQAATDVCAAAPNASDAQVLVYGPQLADLLAQASTAHAGFTARLNEHPTQ